MAPNVRIFTFALTLQQDKFNDADFKYDNSPFKFQHKNMQIRDFVPNLDILVREILQLDKFGVLVSKMTIVFSNSTPKTRKSGIFGPKFKDFYFAPYFAIRQI